MTSPITLDTFTVLTALHKDPRSASEKEIAGVLLRVWVVLDPQPEDGGEAMLNAAFPGSWRTHPLVQLAGSIAEAMDKTIHDEHESGKRHTAARNFLNVWTQSAPGGTATPSRSSEPPLPPNLMTPRDLSP